MTLLNFLETEKRIKASTLLSKFLFHIFDIAIFYNIRTYIERNQSKLIRKGCLMELYNYRNKFPDVYVFRNRLPDVIIFRNRLFDLIKYE